MIDRIFEALLRCGPFALSIFMTYLVSSSVGIFMVHGGNRFALAHRDKIVGVAISSDKAAVTDQSGNHVAAAGFDFTGNLLFGGIRLSCGPGSPLRLA